MIVPFLLYPTLIRTDWSDVKMFLNGQDLLATLDKTNDTTGGTKENFLQNIMNRNETELENMIVEKFSWLKSRKMNFGIETQGTIKNEIRVGFNCTESIADSCLNDNVEDETEYIEKILSSTFINGRYVYFRVFPVSYDEIQYYNVRNMDVFLIRGEEQRNDANINHFDDIKGLVDKGIGVVGFYYVQNINAGDRVDKEIFGIRMGGAAGSIENVTFLNDYNASRPNYAIQKYFYAVGLNENFTYKLEEHNETFMTLWNEQYWVRRNDTDLDRIYDALDLDTDPIGSYDYDLFGKKENDEFIINFDGINYEFKIEKIDPKGKFFIVNFNRTPKYIFVNLQDRPVRPDKQPPSIEEEYVVLESSSNKGALIVNGTDSSPWRSAWITDGNGDDINALVKSSLMWVSERNWWNILRTVSGEHTKISYFVSQGEEFHEPYWLELNLWHIY